MNAQSKILAVYLGLIALVILLSFSACAGPQYVYECQGHEVERIRVK